MHIAQSVHRSFLFDYLIAAIELILFNKAILLWQDVRTPDVKQDYFPLLLADVSYQWCFLIYIYASRKMRKL